MKELDKFFEGPIKEGIIKKSSSSKIYPILKNMEDYNLIIGDWKKQDNKNVKFYSITDKGDLLLRNVREKHKSIGNNPQWRLFFDDFYKD